MTTLATNAQDNVNLDEKEIIKRARAAGAAEGAGLVARPNFCIDTLAWAAVRGIKFDVAKTLVEFYGPKGMNKHLDEGSSTYKVRKSEMGVFCNPDYAKLTVGERDWCELLTIARDVVKATKGHAWNDVLTIARKLGKGDVKIAADATVEDIKSVMRGVIGKDDASDTDANDPKSEAEMLTAALKALDAVLNGTKSTEANGMKGRPAYSSGQIMKARDLVLDRMAQVGAPLPKSAANYKAA